jgi:uncharacterized protein YcbX
MLTVSQLFIYPIKSLGGFEVSSAALTDRGFMYDRRWMLVDEDNRFLTQREIPEMALLQCKIEKQSMVITHKISGETFSFDLNERSGYQIAATIWDDTCEVAMVNDEANQWFTTILGNSCRLVFMPDESKRKVERPYAKNAEITSLSDAYPLLVIGQASLDDLNSKLETPVGIDRFRPNIVFTGGYPYQEDDMKHFQINKIDLFGVKPCARCTIITTNQQTAQTAKEPLKTLATYRMSENKVLFGMNVLFTGDGKIKVDDTIVIPGGI